jgi:hypothetical protein
MSHPFEKLFEKALKKSTLDDNFVLEEAEKIRGRGYSEKEILAVLMKLQKSLINENDEKIMQDAIDEFSEVI